MIATVNNQLDDVIINFQFTYSKSSGRLICKLVLDPERKAWFPSVQVALIDILKSKFSIHINNCDIILEKFYLKCLKQKTITVEE